jgi:PAS domain S-box-containing protein
MVIMRNCTRLWYCIFCEPTIKKALAFIRDVFLQRRYVLLSILVIALCFAVPVQPVLGAPGGGNRPKIIVGGDHSNPPYEFLENGKPTGFNIELMKAVADAEGLEVEFRLGPWGEVRRQLEQGKIDALAGMYYSPERNRLFDFSVPHTMVTSAIFVRKGSPVRSIDDIKWKEIIVQKGDVIHDYLTNNHITPHIITVTDPDEALRLLASGRHECAMMPSRYQGEYLARKLNLSHLDTIKADLPQLRYSFAVQKGNRDLLYRLDEGLNILRDNGKYREIYDKWFGVYEKKALWDTVKYYVLALAIALTLFLGFLIWSAMLKRRVDERTADVLRSQEKLRFTQYAIDSTVNQAFWMTKDGRMFYVNDAACNTLGYSREELMGMTIPDIDPTYPPEKFAEHWRELQERGSVTMESYHRAKDGRVYPVEIRANYVVFDGNEYNCAFATDISRRKRAEQELRQAHDELEKRVEERTAELVRTTEALIVAEQQKSLFLNVTDALILYYDTDMNILWANKAAGDSVHLTNAELQERHCWEVWHQRREPCVGCPVLLARDTGQPQEAETCSPDGRAWFIRGYPVKNEAGRLMGMVELCQDFTERKLMEEALRKSESTVRRKLESILDPEGDIGALDLSDILDAEGIQKLMDDLYRNTGIKLSIIDLKGKVLVDVGWQEICLQYHRGHPETREKCCESDTVMTEGVPQGEFRTYRCMNNMWHLVTPIFVGGRHMGNLFMGQFFFENEEPDYDLFRAQARKYGFPEEEYMAALEAVPRHSEEYVNYAKAFFLRLIDMFSRLSYGNIKLARLLAERDRLAEALGEREALLKLAMDLAKMGAWEYDVGTGMFSFDDQFYALYGTTVEREGGALMPAEVYARKFIPPEEFSIVADGIEHIQADSYLLVEHRIIRADGEERFIIVRGEAVFDQEGRFVKTRGANQDITEQKRAEEEIRESRAKYQAIVDNFDGMIYICSQDYRIEFMNKKMIERTGHDGVGEFCYKVMHDRDSVCPWCVNERVFAGETLHWEMFSPMDNHWYHVVNVPFPRADGSMSKQSMMLDITDRKMFEEQLKEKTLLLEELNSTLEKRVRDEVAKNREKDIILIQQNRQAALGELLDHIAHQWKQPLSAISLVTSDLKESCMHGGLPREAVSDTADCIVSLVQDMSQMVNVFRDFYRPDKEMAMFRVKDSIERAITFVNPALRFDSIVIELDADPDLAVVGYSKEYAQVILNILSNAREVFAERNVEKPIVKIRAFNENDKAIVTITDNGGGISDNIIGKVFDLYFTTKESRGGSGVGLHMSRNIIEKNMGGELSVRNVDDGAQFRIELNIAECQASVLHC